RATEQQERYTGSPDQAFVPNTGNATSGSLRSGACTREVNDMAKKVTGYIKLQVPAGQANPSPPVGPALGQHGVNIMEFCKAFNAATQGTEAGMPIPVVITVYSDRSFTFVTRTPP